jgi:hypothetical protein
MGREGREVDDSGRELEDSRKEAKFKGGKA